MSGHGYWLKDAHGRVGRIVEPGVIEYAYGTQRAPVVFTVMTSDDGEREFQMQRTEMWTQCTRLEKLSHAVLAKLGCGRDTMRHDELHCDVGIPTLCRAAVMHDESRGKSLEQYARWLLRNAYRRALRTPEEHTLQAKDRIDTQQLEPSLGLEDREELYSMLEPGEVELLLARYDSGMSLKDIASEMGMSSRQTALNHINRIIERCRARGS